MKGLIRGLHHVTALARDANVNNAFLTGVLGLRRVKKTVNFDAPEVYHLYYGDAAGTPGTVMTYFPFPGAARGRPGAGEVGATAFAVPKGSLPFWRDRLSAAGAGGLEERKLFGERRLHFQGPDGDAFALVETSGDARAPWTGGGVPEERAIRGFHSVSLRLADAGPTAELLGFMGYAPDGADGRHARFVLTGGNGAGIVEIETAADAPAAVQGAGSAHHVAFAVPDLAAQAGVRAALADAGFRVTPPIDRDYFWAIYFRTPGGILFEVATEEPGFARDEDPARLGEALKLPRQHEHLRPWLEANLPPIAA